MLFTNILFRRDLSHRHATYSSSFLFITVIMIWSQRRCAQRTRYATTAATNDGNGKVYSHLFGPIIPAGSDEISCSITCHAFSGRGFQTRSIGGAQVSTTCYPWYVPCLLSKPSWRITRNPYPSSSEMGPNAGTGISVTSYERPYPRICNASRIVKCR